MESRYSTLYLNGRLAVSENAPETITYRSVAKDDHDAGDIEEFRVPFGLNQAIDRLGDDRATIGDFACWIHCFLGLAAR